MHSVQRGLLHQLEWSVVDIDALEIEHFVQTFSLPIFSLNEGNVKVQGTKFRRILPLGRPDRSPKAAKTEWV